jgi:hypothetical protein
MRKKGLLLGISLALVLIVRAPASQYKVVGEQGDFYFGHISYVDIKNEGKDPVVLREGMRAPEIAVLNLPLGPGDVIQTSDARRCEIQFDNGTIVRLDVNTKLKIETILARSLSTARKISNLLLAQGQVYVMYKKYDSLEIFQIITPLAAVKPRDNSVASVEMSDGQAFVQMERGSSDVLYGKDKNDTGQKKVNARERVVVGSENIIQPTEYAASSEFKSWNEKINANFPELHEGNALPKPIQNLPKAVFEFAQNFGNINGQWIWHDLYGYVWRPYINDFRYPWGTWQANWQPYFYGNWTDYKGQLYWVPGEPWGWVPYHLGIWMWDKKTGWVWMPGSLFAPAWVDWEFYFGNYFWRPFSLFDFYDAWPDDYFVLGYLYGGWNGAFIGPGGTPPPGTRQPTPVRTVVTKDELKKKTDPSLPLPKELKGTLKATIAALKRGDERVLSSLRETVRQSVIIRKEDFGKPGWQGKVISFERLLERPDVLRGGKPLEVVPSEAVARDALRKYEAVRTVNELNARLSLGPQGPARTVVARDFLLGRDRTGPRPDAVIQGPGGSGGRAASTTPGQGRVSAPEIRGDSASRQPGMRFRDWNPDVRVAVRLGIDISYSSRTNEVFAPQLGLRSRDVGPGSRLSPDSFAGFGSGPGGGTGPGMGSPGAQSSTAGQSSGSSAPRGSSKESGGGKKG